MRQVRAKLVQLMAFLLATAQGTPGEALSTPQSVDQAPQTAQIPTDPDAELANARSTVAQHPLDAKAHFALAEALKKTGRQADATKEYLETVKLAPTFYLAFHQLSQVNANSLQLKEAIDSLNKTKEANPNDLMLRVALSELLEKQDNCYQAARVLVDLVYQNAVPDKYLSKVNARIHYLLAKAKESQEMDQTSFSQGDLDEMPPPESILHGDLSSLHLRESQPTHPVGNAPLFP